MTVGQRIAQWLRSFTFWQIVSSWWTNMRSRKAQITPLANQMLAQAWRSGDYFNAWAVHLSAWLYILFGDIRPEIEGSIDAITGASDEIRAFSADPQGWMQSKLHQYATSPGATAFAEFVGTIVTEPVVSLLEQYAGDENIDPHDMARAFHGIASGLPWASTTIDGLLKSLLGERAPQPGKYVMSLYWGLGLGFLGWQTLAPLLSSGLQPRLNRYYGRLYRPARFSPNQMVDLFAAGLVSQVQVAETLRDQGWRESDLALWVAITYRQLPLGDLWGLFWDGKISKGRMDAELRKSGYNPADIPLLYISNAREDKVQAPKVLVSTVKRAYLLSFIDSGEFRQTLGELNYSTREIDLQLQILDEQKQERVRELSTGQIEGLFKGARMDQSEAQGGLRTLGYSNGAIADLISLWREEAAPRPTRINRSTISEAYSWGVITRGEAKNKLTADIGYGSADAELILKIEDAQLQAAAEVPEVEPVKLGLGLLKQLFDAGLLTTAQLAARPEFSGYRTEDRSLVIGLITAVKPPEVAVLSQGAILEAYRVGVVTRAVAKDRLVQQLRFAAADAETLLQIEDAFIAEAAEVPEVEPVRLSLSFLKQLYDNDLISREQLAARPEILEFRPEDRPLVVSQLVFEPAVEPTPLDRGTLLQAYLTGLIERSVAIERLQVLGLSGDDARLAIEVADRQKLRGAFVVGPQGAAPAPLSLLSDFVRAGLMTRGELEARPELERYAAEDRARIIELIINDAQLVPAELSEAVLAQAYVLGVIDREMLAQRFGRFGLSASDIETTIRVIELGNPEVFGEFTEQFLRRPSAGQLQLALQREIIDEGQFRARLGAQGYNEEAIEILLFNAAYVAPAEPRDLSKADIVRLYRLAKISRTEALRRLIGIGYTIEDASLLIEAEGLVPEDTEVGQAYIAGWIDELGVSAALTDLGFTTEEIDNFIELVATGDI